MDTDTRTEWGVRITWDTGTPTSTISEHSNHDEAAAARDYWLAETGGAATVEVVTRTVTATDWQVTR